MTSLEVTQEANPVVVGYDKRELCQSQQPDTMKKLLLENENSNLELDDADSEAAEVEKSLKIASPRELHAAKQLRRDDFADVLLEGQTPTSGAAL